MGKGDGADFESMGRNQVAKAFGVHALTITRWHKKGMPRHNDGTYSLPECIAWAIEQVRGDDEKPETGEGERWLTELRKQKALIASMERERMEGGLLPRSEVEAAIAEAIIVTQKAFLLLPKTQPTILFGLNAQEMGKQLTEAVDEILTGMASAASIEIIETRIAGNVSRS